MGRRQLVVLLSALAMIGLGGGLVAALVTATQSDAGRAWIGRQITRQLQRGVKGKLHVGRLSGSFLTDLAIDSVSITDPDDSVFVAIGRVRVTFDPRDVLDGRIILRSVDLQHPFAVIRRGNDDRWNFRKVFPSEDEGTPARPQGRTAFGSVVSFLNVRIHGGHFQLTLPWQPDDSLRGARRDSAIVENLASPTNEIRRVLTGRKSGFQRTWRWTDASLTLTRARFRTPDTTGRRFEIARLDITEHVPPFRFRNLSGDVTWKGDTIWADFRHFELPGSTGRALGTVRWGDDKPIRYDVRVHSDSVSLADIHWVHETLPMSGLGSMDLHIKNQRDLRVIDYAITNMDVRSTGSRLKGAMTYGVGAPVLIVKDVNLELVPVDFALLETLNGARFPLPWKGTVRGTARGPGGPVNHFLVDEARLEFSDGNVPGATARGTARGELDLLRPGDTKFHALQIDVAHFDLRTAQFLTADFPRVNGVVAGTAVLDSIWSDVRFRDADLTHTDGDSSPVSRFKGAGRVTLGDEDVAVDLAATALPLSATTLARSYPRMPLRGSYSGTLRVKGTVGDLDVSTDLAGDAGRVQLDARFDAQAPRYGAVAHGSVSGLDFRRALERPGAPTSSFNGRFSFQVEGDSLANLVGMAQVVAGRSMIDDVRMYAGQASLHFDGGFVGVDSLRAETTAGLIVARGGLGLVASRTDSLRFRGAVDSLGGLRRYLARRPAGAANELGKPDALTAADSLEGALTVSGSITGNLARFGVAATLEGSGVRMVNTTARRITAAVRLAALPDSVTGAAEVRVDAVRRGSLALSRVDLRADLLGDRRALASMAAEAPRGAAVRASAEVRWRGDTTDVRLDSLAIETTGNSWSLARAASFAFSGGGFGLDSLSIAGARGGQLAAAGLMPAAAPIQFAIQAEAIPLADLGEILQSTSSLGGLATMRADLRGTRDQPEFLFTGSLQDARRGGLRLERVQADGRYANRRLTTSLEYERRGVPALHAEATLPLDLSFSLKGSRWLEEPLTGRVRTDSTGVDLLESISGAITGASGALALDLDLAGTWKHPRLTGALKVRDGAFAVMPLGAVKWSGVDADVGFLGDSIVVRSLAARSGAQRGALAGITGWIGIREVENPTFDLRLTAQAFNLVNRPRFADLDLTGDLHLTGAYRSANLGGSLTVDRGTIYLPELYQKRVISLDDPEFYRVVDTSALVDHRILPEAPSAFVENLAVRDVPVQMGRDVWLRSEEANINLGGLVNITRGRVLRGSKAGDVQLALDGPLQTVRGTWRLNLGPVQRTFEVENGEVRFLGDPDLNATLNINALHTVRQYSQQGSRPDVRVRVHIGGTLGTPTAELSSPDSARVTNAELISYLVTGNPSYEIGGRNGDYTSAAARVLVSSFGSVIGGKASGGLCDDAQLSTAGLDSYQRGIAEVGGNLLARTRFNCAKQLSEKVFVRLDAGLCQVGQLLGSSAAASDPLSFADAIGVKLDYRVSPSVTASVGLEPPTAAVLCARDANARGFAPTPRQFGFDLFRIWRF